MGLGYAEAVEPALLTDEALYTQTVALRRHLDRDALSDPLRLARHLDPKTVTRPHLRVASEAIAELEPGGFGRLLIVMPPQVGKPIYIGSMILMGDGSRKPLAEVRVGDEVITHRGRSRAVTAVHEQGYLPTVRITTASGRSTVAALDHPFLTPEGWVNAGELRPGSVVAAVPTPTYEPSSTLTPEDARLLGYFVGDGSTARTATSIHANITTASPAVEAEIERCCFALGFTTTRSSKPGQNKAWCVNVSQGVRPWLARHGLAGCNSHTKRVPPEVFTASPEAIAEFVGGYWDCDGTITSRGKGRDGTARTDVRCELYSVSRDLLADVQHLLLRLGIRSNIRVKNATINGKPHVSYRLSLIRTDDVARFRNTIRLVQEGRRDRLAAAGTRRTEFDEPFIPDPVVAVEPTGHLECRCLTVDEDHTFTSDDLVVHNSVLAAVWSPFWWLCLHPHLRGIIGCYAANLAVKRGRSVRRLVQMYGARYGLELEKGTQAANDWSTTAGGGIRSAGVGGSITGMPADVGVIDDPLKGRAEAESPRIREKIWDWYTDDFYSRLAPGAPIIIMSTRWHEDDLIGRLISEEGTQDEGGRWRLVYLPAVAVAEDRTLGIRPDALARTPGTPLTHPRIRSSDRAALERYWGDKRTATGPRGWGALFQGNPRPTEGALVSRELLRQRRDYQPAATPTKHAVAVDPAGGGRSVAGIIGGWLGDDGRLYWSADRSAVLTSERWSEAACMLAAEIDAERIFVEANYGGDMYRVVATAWDTLRRRALAFAARHGVDTQAAATASADTVTQVEATLLLLGATGPKLAVSPDLDPAVVRAALIMANEPLPDDTAADYAATDAAARDREAARKQLMRRLIIRSERGGRISPDVLAGAIAAARYARLSPRVEPSWARKGKVLRAEPVAQQLVLDRIRIAAPLPEMEDEWATWQPDSPESPGRIDASVHLALQLLPIPGADQLISSPAGVSRSAVTGSGAAGMPVMPRGEGYRPFGGG